MSTSLEKLKSIHLLEKDLPKDIILDLIQKQGMNIADFQNRMKGYDKENEFIIVLNSLNIVKNIIKFDESINKMFNMHTSDFEIELKSGQKFLLEIKSLFHKDKYTFSENYFNKIKNFAYTKGLDLIFVFCFYNFWMCFNDLYIEKNKRSISLKDFNKSILYKIFGLKSYIFLNGLETKAVYNKSLRGKYINHEKYGGLVSEVVTFRGKKLFKYMNDNNYIAYLLCLEALNERLENRKIVNNENFTTIISTLKPEDKVTIIQESEIILSQILHTENITINDELLYNNLKQKKQHYQTVEKIRYILYKLKQNGLIMYELHDSEIY